MIRGVINNRDRARQIKDYSGLRYDKITPTDIDGFIDFGNKHFVILEYKLVGTEIPYGQKLALVRLCDAAEAGGVDSWLLIADHGVRDCNEDIDCAMGIVRQYYHNHVWRDPMSQTTVFDAIQMLRHSWGME